MGGLAVPLGGGAGPDEDPGGTEVGTLLPVGAGIGADMFPLTDPPMLVPLASLGTLAAAGFTVSSVAGPPAGSIVRECARVGA